MKPGESLCTLSRLQLYVVRFVQDPTPPSKHNSEFMISQLPAYPAIARATATISITFVFGLNALSRYSTVEVLGIEIGRWMHVKCVFMRCLPANGWTCQIGVPQGACMYCDSYNGRSGWFIIVAFISDMHRSLKWSLVRIRIKMASIREISENTSTFLWWPSRPQPDWQIFPADRQNEERHENRLFLEKISETHPFYDKKKHSRTKRPSFTRVHSKPWRLLKMAQHQRERRPLD